MPRAKCQEWNARIRSTVFELWRVRYPNGWAADDVPCFYCVRLIGRTEPWTLDHLTPVARGGLTTLCNVVPCCKACNAAKADLTLPEFRDARDVDCFPLETFRTNVLTLGPDEERLPVDVAGLSDTARKEVKRDHGYEMTNKAKRPDSRSVQPASS